MEVDVFKNIVQNVENFKKAVKDLVIPTTDKFQTISQPSFDDIVVLTATQDEFDSFAHFLEDFHQIHVANDENLYFKGVIKLNRNSLTVVMPLPTDMGIASAAIVATKSISSFRPKFLFMVGVAAGIKAVTKIGDIIIAEKALDYNEIVEIESADKSVRTKFMNNIVGIPPNVKSRIQVFLKTFNFDEDQHNPLFNKLSRKIKTHLGILVSGSSLIRSNERIEQLTRDFHNVKGIDMETIGVYKAVNSFDKNIAPKFLSIKAVSDYGSNYTDNEFKNADERKQLALFTGSTLLYNLIKSGDLL